MYGNPFSNNSRFRQAYSSAPPARVRERLRSSEEGHQYRGGSKEVCVQERDSTQRIRYPAFGECGGHLADPVTKEVEQDRDVQRRDGSDENHLQVREPSRHSAAENSYSEYHSTRNNPGQKVLPKGKVSIQDGERHEDKAEPRSLKDLLRFCARDLLP